MELFKVMLSYQYCLAGGRLLEKINIYWTYIVYQRTCRTLCVLSHVFLRKVLWSISILSVDKTLELRKFIMKLLNLLLSQDWEVLFFKKKFNWSIIALQNFVVFYQTSTWISHRYTYIPSRVPPHPTPLGWYRAPVWVPWVNFKMDFVFKYK